MKKFTAIILASLIMALPLYGCYGNSNDNNTDESKTSITESSKENENNENNENEEKDETDNEDNKIGKPDKLTYNTATSNAQTIELAIKVCMADILAKNNEIYDGVSSYIDAFGDEQVVGSTADTYTTIDENGNPVVICPVSVADVAGINAINDCFKTVTYNNTEYSPYWIIDEDTCVFLDSEGNSMDGDSYDINSSNVVALTKDGIPNSEVYIDTLSIQIASSSIPLESPDAQLDIPQE